MLALRYYGRRDIRLEKVEKPKPKEGEVLIKVTHAGFSQTQVNEFMEGPFIINTYPHPLTGKKIPLIPCQEYGGIVEEVGKGVPKDLLGRKVAVLPLVSCGSCEFCKAKRENLCSKVAYHGLLGLDGGFAEYSVVRVENILPVKNDDLLTFIEPLLVGIHSLSIYKKLLNPEGKKVLVLGAGAVGIATALAWQVIGKAEVSINEILPRRMERVEKGGFRVLTKEELSKMRFDVVIDAAGMDPISPKAAIVEGFQYLKKGGVLLDVGTYFHPVSIVPSSFLLKENFLLTSIAYNSKTVDELKENLHLLARSLDFSIFIEEIKLQNIIEDGYFRAEVDKDSFTRLVVRC